jgi:hypothetical protein
MLSATPRQGSKTNAPSDGMVAIGVACGDGTFIPLATRTSGKWLPMSTDEGINQFYAHFYELFEIGPGDARPHSVLTIAVGG